LAAVARAIQGLAGGFAGGQATRSQLAQEKETLGAFQTQLNDPNRTASQNIAAALQTPGIDPGAAAQIGLQQQISGVQAQQAQDLAESQARQKRINAAAAQKPFIVNVGEEEQLSVREVDADGFPTGKIVPVSEPAPRRASDPDFEKKADLQRELATDRLKAANERNRKSVDRQTAKVLDPIEEGLDKAKAARKNMADLKANLSGERVNADGTVTKVPRSPAGVKASIAKFSSSMIGISRDLGFDPLANIAESLAGGVDPSLIPGSKENNALRDNVRNVSNLAYALASIRKPGRAPSNADLRDARESLQISGMTSADEVLQALPRVEQLFEQEVRNLEARKQRIIEGFQPSGTDLADQITIDELEAERIRRGL
jgi:hypothetical protein